MSEEILQRVKRVVREQLGVKEDEIQPTTNFIEDLGADSLDHVELVMSLEEEFEMEIPDEWADRFLTVQNVMDYFAAFPPTKAAA